MTSEPAGTAPVPMMKPWKGEWASNVVKNAKSNIPPSLPSSLAHREEEAIKLDGLSVAEMKQLRDSAETFVFQAEVNRMMKLIINSLYRNKEVTISLSLSPPLHTQSLTIM